MTEPTVLVVIVCLYLFSAISDYYKDTSYNSKIFVAGFIIHSLLVIYRVVKTGQPPFIGLYGNLLLLPLLIVFRLVFWQNQFSKFIRRSAKIFALLILGAAILLPASMKQPQTVKPALKSIWMFIHVPAYFVGYMSIIIALIFSISILMEKNNDKQVRKKLCTEVKISFFLLNFGMITGAFWAYQSWGNYWSWDPKETWALINILILSLFFYEPNLKKRAWIVVFTFLSILFTFLGVNYILPGLHSYL